MLGSRIRQTESLTWLLEAASYTTNKPTFLFNHIDRRWWPKTTTLSAENRAIRRLKDVFLIHRYDIRQIISKLIPNEYILFLRTYLETSNPLGAP